MSLLHSKLHFLNYHAKLATSNRPPLEQTHFSLECGGLGPNRRGSLNRRQQFLDFLMVGEHLLKLIDKPGCSLKVTVDDAPHVISSELLACLGKCGFVSTIGELNPMQLTSGWGEGVCEIVDWLCDEGLKAKGAGFFKAAVRVDEDSDAEGQAREC